MTAPEEAVRRRGRRRGGCGASKAATSLLFIWVVLIFYNLGLLCALESSTGNGYTGNARKTTVFKTEDSSFHPPEIASSSMVVGAEANRNPASSSPSAVVYEDDKRLIHTGSNPLHN